MSKEDGGQAFPTPATEHNFFYEGMTLRDYFAAKAMQGVFASGCNISIGPSHKEAMERLAETFYLVADAMLAARGQ